MLDYDHLSALAAVVRTGSFEKAAQQLGVTPSAVSQRLKLLEERIGAALVVRGQPNVATPAGARLCRHAEDVGLLERALRADLGELGLAAQPTTIRIAVNADSLATWFVEAMAATEGVLYDLVLDDQDHSADWLRRGEVAAAVTASTGSVQGCGSRPLGALRYVATASPEFMRRWFADGVDEAALRAAPCLRFNQKDELQARWIRNLIDRTVATPTHWLPASQAFVDGALAGLGWGMNPEPLVRHHLASGHLVLLAISPLDVSLNWQWSRAVEAALADVTRAVTATARRFLVQ
ncbi:transcriptional regulator ArgP [Aliidongia dinghuensis]|uniref:Transcriptional regulator ArgP n=1 Tax=Aliidongia dinghuensis TaxID=1867774 RepID=A0A8J2YXD4_9PROT|nr:LysR family transcriptional regulator ArgP [Aliidongia dinghuensis]GGF34403.1 transcriptional regulator ArgP [Aliidongia dinghuensis]